MSEEEQKYLADLLEELFRRIDGLEKRVLDIEAKSAGEKVMAKYAGEIDDKNTQGIPVQSSTNPERTA